MSVNSWSGNPPKYGLCIDWETSGAERNGKNHSVNYQGVSFGALIFEFETLEPVDGIYVEIKFDDKRYKWSNDAEKVHGLTRKHLQEHGKTAEEAACELATLILKYMGPQPTCWILCHNREFDLDFTRQLLEPFELMPNVAHVALDTSPLALFTLGKYRSEDIFDILELPKREDHNALEDANHTLTTARMIREIFRRGLGL